MCKDHIILISLRKWIRVIFIYTFLFDNPGLKSALIWQIFSCLSEYDALAKVIQHHPDRHETLKELEALGKELEHLSHIKESVEDKLELRRKQFHVLLSTIHELQQTLENDDKLSEVDEAQESTMEADPKP